MFFIITTLFFTAFATYFGWRFIYSLNIDLPIKISLFVFVLLMVNHSAIVESLNISLPDNILLIMSWFLIVVVLSSAFAFCIDVIAFIIRIFHIKVATVKFMPIILIITSIICTYGVYEGVRVPRVKEVSLSFSNLPKELEGIKIAQIADPHIGRFFRADWLNKAIDITLEQKADVIVLTGDAIDAPFEAIKNDVLPFNRLQAPLGVYFVAGNHEYINEYEVWIEYFNSLSNIIVIENANETIKIGNSIFNIFGLTDPIAERFNLSLPNAELALKGLEDKKQNEFRLLLAHRPYNKENELVKADLQLSGHTHGGIISLIKQLTSNANGGYVSGLYKAPTKQIYVSNGMGVWDGFPMRLGVPSEITIITLTKK